MYCTLQDVAAKLLSFAQQRPRALCILSGNGAVSAVTLRQFTSSAATVTYEVVFYEKFNTFLFGSIIIIIIIIMWNEIVVS